jgi:hypothetical protein
MSLAPNTLRRLLFGTPFSERADGVDPAIEHLDCLIRDLIELLRAEHGDSCRAFGQAERELTTVLEYEGDVDRKVAARRGILLFAIWRDPDVAERFTSSDGELLAQLRRHLPIVAPCFLSELGQRPDAFVALCATLTTLWPDTTLCLPRVEGAATGEVGA